MTNSLHHFSPATTGETIVYGACRPGYPSRTVSHSAVQEWIAFMREQQIARVVCLLPPSQLRYYSDVLGLYREAFGSAKVCWAPIEDYHLADVGTLTDTVLPFLADAAHHQEKTVVHCSGGIGRTGHVLAAWLVSHRRMSNDEATEAVSRSGRDARESGDSRLDALLDACRRTFAAEA
jgi:protein-tyrosine phosphatase